MSLIPPKKPRKPGMPKLTIPGRPSSSSSAPAAHSDLQDDFGNSDAASISGSQQRPQPSIVIPQVMSGSASSSSLHHLDDEFEEGHSGPFPSNASTIYPNTVPHLTNAQMHSALTDDLRRAIGNVSLSDESERIDSNGLRIPATSSRNSYNGYWVGNDASARPHTGDSSASSDRHDSRSRAGSSSSLTSARSNTGDEDLVLPDHIEILSRLGEGASGEVQKVRHKPSGMLMAKKTISTSANPAIHRQILRELAFNRSCHSDYIVRYYGAFLEDQDSSISICMEFCEAGSLDAIYKKVKSRNGRTGEKVLGKVSECVLKGLGYLHERKIIHRDIKPSNILVTRQGQIKLCDFGVSGELINSVAGTFTGTSYYMAPERIRGLAYTITSDVWSLGLTILEVASNRFPFPADGEPPLGPIDLLSYVVNMKVPELQDDEKAGIKWSRGLKDFIERCLEKEPLKRPGPHKMTSHPFIRKSETRQPQPDIAKFVADVWGWTYLPSTVAGQQDNTPTQTESGTNAALQRIPSVRSAPIASAALTSDREIIKRSGPSLPCIHAHEPSPLSTLSATTGSNPRLRALPKIAMPFVTDGLHSSTAGSEEASVASSTSLRLSADEKQSRSQQDRIAARMREADVGLIGSPTQTDDDS